jgi:hypothetical protein
MGSRPIMVATLLGASVGVPYAMSRSQAPKPAPAVTSPFGNPSVASAVPGIPSLTTPNAPPLLSPVNQSPAAQHLPPPAFAASSVEGVRFHSLAEVLRFDVTKEWVYSNWPRKSTGLADPELYGVRVPLVTGTAYSDLAGAITYSFNRDGQVQHISFYGRTGDTTQLIQFVTSNYKLERRDALAGEQLYQLGSDDRVQSELRTRPDQVLRSSSPHGSFAVSLELERPGSDRYLPPTAPKFAFSPTQPTPQPPPAAASQTANGSESSWWDSFQHSTYDNIRKATPAEDNQVQWRRWPN